MDINIFENEDGSLIYDNDQIVNELEKFYIPNFRINNNYISKYPFVVKTLLGIYEHLNNDIIKNFNK